MEVSRCTRAGLLGLRNEGKGCRTEGVRRPHRAALVVRPRPLALASGSRERSEPRQEASGGRKARAAARGSLSRGRPSPFPAPGRPSVASGSPSLWGRPPLARCSASGGASGEGKADRGGKGGSSEEDWGLVPSNWEEGRSGPDWKGITAIVALTLACGWGAQQIFNGILGFLPGRSPPPPKPLIAEEAPGAHLRPSTKEPEQPDSGGEQPWRAVPLEPEDLFGGQDDAEDQPVASGSSLLPPPGSWGGIDELCPCSSGSLGVGDDDAASAWDDNEGELLPPAWESVEEEQEEAGPSGFGRGNDIAAEEKEKEDGESEGVAASLVGNAAEASAAEEEEGKQQQDQEASAAETQAATRQSSASTSQEPYPGLIRKLVSNFSAQSAKGGAAARGIEATAGKDAERADEAAAPVEGGAGSSAALDEEQDQKKGEEEVEEKEKELPSPAGALARPSSSSAAAAAAPSASPRVLPDAVPKEAGAPAAETGGKAKASLGPRSLPSPADGGASTAASGVRLPPVPPMAAAVEMPSSAVDISTLELPKETTLEAYKQRASIAYSAANAASEASNRAAAYAAAASAAASKAAEASNHAAVAAHAAQEGVNGATEEAMQAAEARAEAASRAAREAEERAAAAAGMASAYQDVAGTQQEVAQRAAQVEPEPQPEPQMGRGSWLQSRLEWWRMSPLYAKALSVLEPIRDFLAAAWQWIVSGFSAAASAVSRLLQWIKWW